MVVGRVDGIEVAGSNASTTAQTVLCVHLHLHGFLIKGQAIVGTLEHTTLASAALRLADFNFPTDMLVALAGTGTASHTDVFDSTAEACHFMSLEVIEADEHIGIHDSPAYLGLLYIFASSNRYFYIVRTF